MTATFSQSSSSSLPHPALSDDSQSGEYDYDKGEQTENGEYDGISIRIKPDVIRPWVLFNRPTVSSDITSNPISTSIPPTVITTDAFMITVQSGTDPSGPSQAEENMLLVLLPMLIVLSTLLFFVLVFLIFVLVLRKRKGVRLGDDSGPIDLSRGDGVIGEGGVDGIEARWLEDQEEDVQRGYKRAKDWQLHYPPSSIPTDITLPQFLSIQEKGVSAWSFEPDYESNPSLFVQSRTEITFFADGPGMSPEEGGGNSVMANLPLPKLNEVYYWECKIFEKDPGTKVAIGLATKPYPSFRMPGLNRNSIAYFSDGFKSHNYPFTAASYGPPLAEGDVLGVGYRPRTGTVFFTRNGRKHEDAFIGLQRFNLFPSVGASGPATVHVNLGQAGFVFIEANVKKWGLAPSVGTLAPPPPYGSERGSILLESGFGSPAGSQTRDRELMGEGSSGRTRSRRANPYSTALASSSASTNTNTMPTTTPARSSPLRPTSSSAATTSRPKTLWTSSAPFSIPRGSSVGEEDISPYVSPVDRESITRVLPPLEPSSEGSGSRSSGSSDEDEADEDDVFLSPQSPRSRSASGSASEDETDDNDDVDGEDEYGEDRSRFTNQNHTGADGSRRRIPMMFETQSSSPTRSPSPPTPNLLDIRLNTLRDRQAIHDFFGNVAHQEHVSPATLSAAAANASASASASVSNSTQDSPRKKLKKKSTTRSTNKQKARSDGTSTSTSTLSSQPIASGSGARHGYGSGSNPRSGLSTSPTATAGASSSRPERSPPSYSPLDPVVYANGVPTDLPASVISAAFEAAERGEAGPAGHTRPGLGGVSGDDGRERGWRRWVSGSGAGWFGQSTGTQGSG
ncbi:SPRY domain-containing proteins [Phaffia rhodozyma]|uniref:SPRY domain-containing proteins n=1 Tax=Phaffia rhodozyma TaxID=264483 RepID=A0A0F7SHI3_PHARH|nr:SPRY domain-containing proteins [Phaffia rhodozyma]